MQKIIEGRTRLISALENLNNKYYYLDDFDLIKKDIIIPIKENRLNDYLIACEDGEKVSFCKGLDNINKRISISLGKYIRRNLKVDYIYEAALDWFVKDIKIKLSSIEDIEKNIVFYTGQEIERFYQDIDKKSKLHSCMTGEDAFKTRLYALNPDKVSLVVYNNVARALLWETDKGSKVLDRIYPDDESFNVFLLKHWANKKGYLDYDSASDSSKHFYISLKHDNIFPYFDTFYFGKKTRKIIKVCNRSFCKQNVYLQLTDGRAEELVICMFCKKTNIKFDFCYYGENNLSKHRHICNSCAKTCYVDCDYCRLSFIEKDLTAFNSKKICKYCLDKKTKPCDKCSFPLTGSYYKIPIDGIDNYFCENCAIDYYTCFKCDTIKDENIFPKTIKRNNFYCPDCMSNAKNN